MSLAAVWDYFSPSLDISKTYRKRFVVPYVVKNWKHLLGFYSELQKWAAKQFQSYDQDFFTTTPIQCHQYMILFNAILVSYEVVLCVTERSKERFTWHDELSKFLNYSLLWYRSFELVLTYLSSFNVWRDEQVCSENSICTTFQSYLSDI